MPSSPTDPLALLLLAAAGLLAGVVNTLAGGGSLLTLPALVFFGLPAGVANGTNRLAVMVQSLSAVGTFSHGGERPYRELWRLLPVTLLGGALGAVLATRFPGDSFRPILGVVLLVMGLYTLARPGLLEGKPPDDAPSGLQRAAQLGGLFLAGVYGGFVQAGVGLLLLAVLVGAMGHPLARANALKVGLVAAFTALALLLFGLNGQVAWLPGLCLALGAGLGGVLGARISLRVQARWLRFVVAAFALASGVKLLLD